MKSGKIAVAAALLLAAACAPRERYIQISGYAQGGVYSVKMNLSGTAVPPERIRHAVDSLLTLVDTTLSGYNKGSILSRFNAGETVMPNEMFMDMYELSRTFFDWTEGAVDVASGPLFDAWGFGFTADSLPSGPEVERILQQCGMGRLRDDMRAALHADGTLDPAELLTAPGPLPRLNFNAIAQGYTCDVIARYLYGIGVKDMLVDIGEIFCDGLNPSGRPWAVGVDRPVDGNNRPGADLTAVWRSSGGPSGLVTSGNYRKFYVHEGRKYSHTIDPRTGYPVQDSLLSATVLAPDAVTADAAATWCMVLGFEEARTLLSGSASLEGCLIYASSSGSMLSWASDGFDMEE